MSSVTRFDMFVILSVAWIAGAIITTKLHQLIPQSESSAEKWLLRFEVGGGILLVAYITYSIARLAG